MGQRLTQVAVEVVVGDVSGRRLRLTQVAVEVIYVPATRKLRLTQIAVEVVYAPATRKLRLSQLAVEVIHHTKPVITNVSDTSDIAPGDSLTITGSQFRAVQGSGKVLFNTRAGTVTAWSATSISVTVPEGVMDGNLYVVDTDGYSSDGVAYTAVAPIVARSFVVIVG